MPPALFLIQVNKYDNWHVVREELTKGERVASNVGGEERGRSDLQIVLYFFVTESHCLYLACVCVSKIDHSLIITVVINN